MAKLPEAACESRHGSDTAGLDQSQAYPSKFPAAQGNRGKNLPSGDPKSCVTIENSFNFIGLILEVASRLEAVERIWQGISRRIWSLTRYCYTSMSKHFLIGVIARNLI
jgi:hypothetical protein